MLTRWSRRLGETIALGICLAAVTALAAQNDLHPLDPLTKAEIEKAVDDLRKIFTGETTRLWMMHLNEPPKEAVLAYRPGQPICARR